VVTAQYACPALSVIIAPYQTCDFATCTDGDCCGVAAKCTGYDGCPPGHVILAAAGSTDCTTSGTCVDIFANDRVCCGAPAKCTGYASCPDTHVLKADLDSVNCATSGSCPDTNGNDAACCEPKGECAQHSCTDGVIVAPNPSCTAAVCTDDECCGAAAKCTGYGGCPITHILKGSPETLDCTTSGQCADIVANDAICCEPKGECASLQHECTSGVIIAPAQVCDSTTCTDEDCCGAEAKCTGYGGCPVTHILKGSPETLDCTTSGQCADIDANDNICCEPKGECSSPQHVCTDGVIIAPDAGTCAAATCTNSDCCGVGAKCTGYDGCPEGQVILAAADTTDCTTSGTCPDTDGNDGTCCGAPAKCTDYGGCPATHTLRGSPETLDCSTSGQCVDILANDDICCEQKMSCEAVQCGLNQKQKHANPSQELCASAVCTSEEEAACCEELAKCTGYSGCPDTHVLKGSLESLNCNFRRLP
jgi:hypothetical protein